MKVKISLGSNFNQTENIFKAQDHLTMLFPDISFSQPIWTRPIGVKYDKYLNCIGEFHYDLSKEKLIATLKNIERLMGDNHSKDKTNKIIIDIDLNTYGKEQLKPIIWLNKKYHI